MDWQKRKRTYFTVTLYVETWDCVERQFYHSHIRTIRVYKVGRYWVDPASHLRFNGDGTQASTSRGLASTYRRRIDLPAQSAKSA